MAESKVGGSNDLNRREFFSWFWMGWITFSVAAGAIVTLLGRYLFPNVLFEKPSSFRAGPPTEFGLGVDERFKDTQSVWIVRVPEGIYALSTVCTHLGCTPNWLPNESKFKCPCHGSGFRMSGLNFEGPAPRPLERFAVSIDETGFVKIDKSRAIRFANQWSDPDFLLRG